MHLFTTSQITASQKILCGYTNPTTKIQIIKISNLPHFFFERAVMPQASILFEAYKDARLEIHTSEMMSAILADVIPCIQLAAQSDMRKQRPQLTQQSA